jgi:GT2 family glycosyltransferase
MALNRGLNIAIGDLIAFTDDDVIVSPDWIKSLCTGARQFPSAYMLCGPITPCFPESTPSWLAGHPFAPMLFASFLPTQPNGPLKHPCGPFGPNIAVRSADLDGVLFRSDLGPSHINGSLMCEDSAFVDELRERLEILPGKRIVFIRDAAVMHRPEPSRVLTTSLLLDRFFWLGRSHVIRFRRLTHLMPNPMERFAGPAGVFTLCGNISFYCGQLYQCHLDGATSRTAYLRRLVRSMGISYNLDHIGPLALNAWKTCLS